MGRTREDGRGVARTWREKNGCQGKDGRTGGQNGEGEGWVVVRDDGVAGGKEWLGENSSIF